MQLLLATKNKDKVREIIAKLAEFDFELISAADRDDLPEVVEDAPDLVGNAIKKAQTLYEITGIPSIADDTGLEVDALNGAPGVFPAVIPGRVRRMRIMWINFCMKCGMCQRKVGQHGFERWLPGFLKKELKLWKAFAMEPSQKLDVEVVTLVTILCLK